MIPREAMPVPDEMTNREPGTAEHSETRIWSIYALVDPRSGNVRYVGKSINVGERVKWHMRDRSSTRKGRWLRQLGAAGLQPQVLILETGTGDWQEAERRWIAHHALVYDLTNLTLGGEGLIDPSPETRAKIAAAQRARWASNREALIVVSRSPQRRAAISAALKGLKKAPEHVAKLPQNRTDYKWSNEVIEARRQSIRKAAQVAAATPRSEKQINHLRAVQAGNAGKPGWAKGRVLKPAEREARSLPLRGRPKSDDHREKIRQAALRRWANHRKMMQEAAMVDADGCSDSPRDPDPRALQARERHRAAATAEEAAARHRAARDAAVKRLREEDPRRWTYAALAGAVGCDVQLIRWILTGDRSRKR